MADKKETVKVEKDFLDSITKTVSELKEQVELLQKEIIEIKSKREIAISTPIPTGVEKEGQSIFWSAEICITNPKSLTEMADFQISMVQFRKQLETLMRKHKVGQVSASLLAKQ